MLLCRPRLGPDVRVQGEAGAVEGRGRVVLTRLVIEDVTKVGTPSIVEILDIQSRPLPDKLFNLARAEGE